MFEALHDFALCGRAESDGVEHRPVKWESSASSTSLRTLRTLLQPANYQVLHFYNYIIKMENKGSGAGRSTYSYYDYTKQYSPRFLN